MPRFDGVEQVFDGQDASERLKAIDQGLAANPDGETRGILQINRALLMNELGDRDGAVKLRGHIALDPTSTFGTEQLAKFSLAKLTKK